MNQSAHLLVVEDEPLIRDIVEIGFEEAGYSLRSAASAEEAIDLVEAAGSQFRALVTDVNPVPGKGTGWGGRETRP